MLTRWRYHGDPVSDKGPQVHSGGFMSVIDVNTTGFALDSDVTERVASFLSDEGAAQAGFHAYHEADSYQGEYIWILA